MRVFAALAVLLLAPVLPAQTTWRFDSEKNVKALHATIEGHPGFTREGVHFNGKDDALFFPVHPLAGAETWTWEMVFRPDPDGQTEQRVFHLQPMDGSGKDIPDMRQLFEIRIRGGQWCLDAHARVSATPGDLITLLPCTPETMHSFGAFHTATATYDGTTLRSYVDGVLEAEGKVHLTPQLPGRASLGTRINRQYYFKGTVYEARFTRTVIPAKDFLAPPAASRP